MFVLVLQMSHRGLLSNSTISVKFEVKYTLGSETLLPYVPVKSKLKHPSPGNPPGI